MTESSARVDLNSDVGESFGRWTIDDAAMLTTVSSANIDSPKNTEPIKTP